MIKQYIIWMLKGAAMGAADAVPGVSGGTMALITGVYERFIGALSSFKPDLIPLLFKGRFKEIWLRIDGAFLLSLGVGILISLFSVLILMHWLLETCEPVVWAFFTGVILVSLWHLLSNLTWSRNHVVLYTLGLLIAGSLSFLTGVVLEMSPLILVIGGAIAISAMLLPGISGSFMLLLLGLYEPIVQAVHDRDFLTILWVALGCLIGILSVSQLLNWALKRWHDAVMAFMLGFVAGALLKVWPWQAQGEWYFPADYTVVTGQSAWLVLSLLAIGVGGYIVQILYTRAAK